MEFTSFNYYCENRPALAAGNTIVIKPSEEASASCLEFANLFKLAGFPDGVINFVTGFGNEIGESLASNPKISLVAFTGGPVGGQKVYTSASSL
ncbi:hypothetical protein CDV26_09965 [Francisella halioticida]|uniref:Aldehyde dehydrogenase domain-containing protein n=1 Tax=Francisella halioticida TaxID=549298 RepID=A0ABM6M1G5_9GAMM|nr:aldehyde dehydrogenase family protein [Francisella halioticida]ASG68671.1 hypothetical protein CDV26_09965 [Francisella halioticida]